MCSPAKSNRRGRSCLRADGSAFPGACHASRASHRLGFRNTGHTLAKLLDPFYGQCVRVASATRSAELARLEAFLATARADALLLKGSEGEPFANPRRRPRMLYFSAGAAQTLFDEEAAASRAASLPAAVDAAATATWIKLALGGRLPVPHPLVNQFACCLFASGYSEDFNQAKAIAAVEAGALAHLPARLAATEH